MFDHPLQSKDSHTLFSAPYFLEQCKPVTPYSASDWLERIAFRLGWLDLGMRTDDWSGLISG